VTARTKISVETAHNTKVCSGLDGPYSPKVKEVCQTMSVVKIANSATPEPITYRFRIDSHCMLPQCILKDPPMNRISLAFRSFFSILFGGSLPADIAQAFGYAKPSPVKTTPAAPVAAPKAQATAADGAVQVLGVLQRDSRLIDFLMEDISAYTDDQVGAAIRDVQVQAKQTLERYLKLQPVIDAVEETTIPTSGLDSASYKLIGKVPPNGKAPSGVLRHRGWKAGQVDLPVAKPTSILVPAELEVE
jgi:hypothetical protein